MKSRGRPSVSVKSCNSAVYTARHLMRAFCLELPRLSFISSWMVCGGLALGSAGCSPRLDGPGQPSGRLESSLSQAQRQARAAQIRDAAAAAGIDQGWLLAGIADAETGMSHCHSELTWACQGPASPDCGGGPVVAGAGDGPCALEQGGLGMFQFDAGTYAQTLAREGERILTVDGNVQAAVDFVASMVIRSVYVDGVDTREQAISWMNGVRVDNARWQPWVTTVTHYYNGCRPEASCFNERFARYRDHIAGIYDEMGAAFWAIRHEWAAQYVEQTFPLARDPFVLETGAIASGYLEMRNVGTRTWRPDEVFLGTTEPRDTTSAIAAPSWLSPSRPGTIDREVPPGQTGRFVFDVRAPAAAGDYPQFFNLVRDGVAWFTMPGDAVIQIRIQSVGVGVDPGPVVVDLDASGVGRADAGVALGDASLGPISADAMSRRDAEVGDAEVDGSPILEGGYDASLRPARGAQLDPGCAARPGRGRRTGWWVTWAALVVVAFRWRARSSRGSRPGACRGCAAVRDGSVSISGACSRPKTGSGRGSLRSEKRAFRGTRSAPWRARVAARPRAAARPSRYRLARAAASADGPPR